jgi:AGZA family xanthine/uracil permease-like MFS transporter
LFYSIAYGVIAGIVSYMILNGVPWVFRKISNNRFSPPNYDASEPWVTPPGGILPFWL